MVNCWKRVKSSMLRLKAMQNT